MMRILTCDECGKQRVPFMLSWAYKFEYCKHCMRTNDRTINYHFCSSDCLLKWVNKFHNHKCDWVPIGGKETIKDLKPGSKYMARCSICNKGVVKTTKKQ